MDASSPDLSPSAKTIRAALTAADRRPRPPAGHSEYRPTQPGEITPTPDQARQLKATEAARAIEAGAPITSQALKDTGSPEAAARAVITAARRRKAEKAAPSPTQIGQAHLDQLKRTFPTTLEDSPFPLPNFLKRIVAPFSPESPPPTSDPDHPQSLTQQLNRRIQDAIKDIRVGSGPPSPQTS